MECENDSWASKLDIVDRVNYVPESRDPDVLTDFGGSSQPMATLMRSMFGCAVGSRRIG
jgi:hypothetical protein